MFESLDVSEYTARETLSSVGELHVLRNQVDVEVLRHALHFADLHPGTATVSDHELVPGGEQSRVYGGSGCPSVAEFAVVEFGVMIGRSSTSAAKYMGQALALRHRLPSVWAQVESGHAAAWKACNIATACMDLSEQAAALVDRRVADIIDTLSPLRLHNIVKAALWEADPITARARAEQQARERGVWAGRTDNYGTTTLFIKAPTGTVIRLQATINQLADALAALGDTTPITERRVRALDILADPALAAELLQVATHLTTTPEPPTNSEVPTEPEAPEAPADPETTREPAPFAGPMSPAAPETTGEPTPPTEPEEPAATKAGAPPAAANDTPSEAASAASAPSVTTPVSATPAPTDTQADPHTVRWPWDDTDTDTDTDAGVQAAPTRSDAFSETRGSDDRGDSSVEAPGLDSDARRELIGKLANLKPTTRRQNNTTTLYLHITDETLLAGEGVARIDGFGPVFATRLEELIGHGHITLKPVIDLKDNLAVDSYEIPQRIRERIRLRHPAEQFPYGTGESSRAVDLDHIEPYKPNGPSKQTNTDNLIPLRRLSHRAKTHGHWQVHRLNEHALEWITRYGFRFIVDHNGTHPADPQ